MLGVINVLILFSVLRTFKLSRAMKSSYSTDSEKGYSRKATISRPLDDSKSPSTFLPEIQGPVSKSTISARSPGATLQGGVSYISSLARSLFLFHKRSASTSSSSRMLIHDPPSRSSSPTSSFESSEPSGSFLPVKRPISPAPALHIDLPVLPEAVQKSAQPSHLKIGSPSQHDVDSTGLSPPPRGKGSQISREPRPISGSRALPTVPLLEVTIYSPTTPPTEGGVDTMINMYISRDPTMSAELPPFPDTAVLRDSSGPSGWPGTRFPALSEDDLPVDVPPEGSSSTLKAALSTGAVGGRPLLPPATPHTKLLSARATPLAGANQHSRFEGDAPPSSVVSAVRDTKAPTQSGASGEGRSSVQDRHALRTLPSSRSSLSQSQRVMLHKVPSLSSSSSRYGYL